MTIVTSYDWESDTWTHNGDNPARAVWREAVAEIAAKAHAKLPECTGRVDSAVKIVLAGDVEVLAGGTAKVASQSNGETVYHVVNGACDCKDFTRAPHSFCKHRLASAIARRAQELVKAPASNGHVEAPPVPALPDVPTAPLPEAPASVNVRLELGGREVQLTLRDSDEGRLLARLDAVLQRFPLVVQPTDDTPRCPTHGVVMTLHHGKDGSTWYSHKTADGWCKGVRFVHPKLAV